MHEEDALSVDRFEPKPRRRRRWKALLVLSVLALAVHAVLLGESGSVAPLPLQATEPPAAMQVRTVIQLPTVTEVMAPPVAPAAPAPEAPPHRVRAGRPLAAQALTVAAAPPVPPVSTGEASREEPIAVLAQQTPASTAAPASDDKVPVYRTHAPPAANLRFVMRRGMLSGNAELNWRPAGKEYELRLDGRIAGLTILSQVSQGGFDAAGLAPVRFTDQRLRGAMNAANFQRQAGKVTFSGPQTEFALQPGVQDRLSWMIQLPAIIAGEPALLKPGARVALHVIGARADDAVWVLRYVGRESVEVAGSAVEAEKFSREESGPHDTAVDIWLDPQRHHLPIRATLRNGGDNDALELILQELTMAP